MRHTNLRFRSRTVDWEALCSPNLTAHSPPQPGNEEDIGCFQGYTNTLHGSTVRPSTCGSPPSSPHATIRHQNPLHATEPPRTAAMPHHVSPRPRHTKRPRSPKVDTLGRQEQPQTEIPIATGQNPIYPERVAGTQDRHGRNRPGCSSAMDRNHDHHENIRSPKERRSQIPQHRGPDPEGIKESTTVLLGRLHEGREGRSGSSGIRNEWRSD